MKHVSCKDVGIIDCTWETSAPSEEELIRQCREHGEKAHNYKLTAEDERKLRAVMHTV